MKRVHDPGNRRVDIAKGDVQVQVPCPWPYSMDLESPGTAGDHRVPCSLPSFSKDLSEDPKVLAVDQPVSHDDVPAVLARRDAGDGYFV